MKAKKAAVVKVTIAILIMTLIFPINVLAAEARASDYLDAYSAYVYPAKLGFIQVWFEVEGTDYMDEIGALEIQLYESTDNENWTWVKTFEHQNDPGMLGYNEFYYAGHVQYDGILGRYYKAYICIWAGENGAGDTRYFWTNTEIASMF